MTTTDGFMEMALALAERARAAGEVPVGALVVSGNRVLGDGFNQPISHSDPTAHAEICALRAASAVVGNYRLVGCDMYVTLEPCIMCYSALVHARIRTLYYGAADPKGGIFSTGSFSKIEGVYNHRIEVTQGVLGDRCADIITAFFQARRAEIRNNKHGQGN